MIITMSKVGSFIKKTRMSRDWSAREMADIIGVTHGAISLAESGVSKQPFDLLTKMSARMLNKDEKIELQKILVSEFVAPIVAGDE
jgi:transcriptional regulator with XRE-family HTH domain